MSSRSPSVFSRVIEAWRLSLQSRSFRLETAVTMVVFIANLVLYPNFLNYIEQRPGVRFLDPVLSMIEPVDATWVTFIILYVSISSAIWFLLREPEYLMMGFQCYVVLFFLRAVALLMVPLEPPLRIIALNDPFVEFFGVDGTLTRDLFFSGHTSLMFLLFLTARTPGLRRLYLSLTVVLAGCVMVQHVHYAFDVFVAPLAAYASVGLVRTAHRSLGHAR
jgi:hypothetical protein